VCDAEAIVVVTPFTVHVYRYEPVPPDALTTIVVGVLGHTRCGAVMVAVSGNVDVLMRTVSVACELMASTTVTRYVAVDVTTARGFGPEGSIMLGPVHVTVNGPVPPSITDVSRIVSPWQTVVSGRASIASDEIISRHDALLMRVESNDTTRGWNSKLVPWLVRWQ
jgi:hypothetical protein